MKRIQTLVPAVLMLSACQFSVPHPDRETTDLLKELDGYISARNMYVVQKRNRIDALSNISREVANAGRRYELEMKIADECFSFSFDSTQAHLKRCIELAGGDRERVALASISLAELYSKAGNHMEANDILYAQTDTTVLDEAGMNAYLLALYNFSHDLSGNSGMAERLSIPPEAPYRDRLLQRLPENSETWRELLRDRFMAQGNLSAADSVSRVLMNNCRPEDRRYAIHAFYRSEIAGMEGRAAERLHWLVKSAECDIMNAVKDYASLTLVATDVLPTDVEHAFQYLQIAQQDALFYNAKLRPWQISRYLQEAQDAYMERQDQKQQITKVLLILLGVLTIILLFLARFLVSRSRKLTRMRQELENLNAQLETANITLNDLNQQVTRADHVKRDYILDFLRDLSEQIAYLRSEDNHSRNLLKQGKADELLKELSINGHSDQAREKFYETFDRTFLGMYPHFIEDFNALLQEDARLSPPKGHLTTELRIFALICMGVDDSKQIASMLDYSLSTIYNYKVEIKNHALGERDSFEQAVKNLGK